MLSCSTRAFYCMEHPLINDIHDLTLEQLQERITELSRKLGQTHRMGNADLRRQVQMALETYQNRYHDQQQALLRQNRTDDPDFADRIDIS